jgi:6-pyruvoyltetrahydropterin/6-carboxytetrahydropterin synthase
MTSPATGFRLRLAKRDFKFSSAHFTLFADREAGALHGHNYQVEIEVEGDELDDTGLLVELADLKRIVRAACTEWDEKVLLPEHSPQLAIERQGDEVVVRYGARRYVFPAVEVILLPLVNTTIELLARWLADRLAPALPGRLRRLVVTVGETDGQSCSYARLVG